MRRLVFALFLLVGCAPINHIPPVYPISQCTEAFPVSEHGYTRPTPTNHPIFFAAQSAEGGQRMILWLDRHCDKFWLGPYDPAHPELYCDYRPDLGDRYYSEQDTAIATPIPRACPPGG